MPKKQRISRVDFVQMDTARMRRVHGVLFTLSVGSAKSDSSDSKPKFACVVSKKVSNHAVDRNRIRRIVKEVARIASINMRGSKTLVFYAKKEAKNADFTAIDSDVRKLLSHA